MTRSYGPCASVALAATLLAGCPSSTLPPTTPDPPQVSLSIPDGNAMGLEFKVNVTVTGCTSVKALGLFDRTQFLKNATYVGPPTQVTLLPNELPYSRGIAADLSLVAKATCDDGRFGESAPQAARFFPVQEVIRSSTGDQVVPDYFYADGYGAGVVFVGCSQDTSGRRYLVKVGTNGAVLGANTTLPFACSNRSTFSDKHPVTGKRWMYEPGVGALVYDSTLAVTGSVTVPVQALGVGPDGDAVIYDNTDFGAAIRRISHRNGATVWSHAPLGQVIAAPVINPDLAVYLAYFVGNLGTYSGTVTVEKLDYRDGRQVARYDLRTISWGMGDAAPIPPVAFNASGTILYLPSQLAGDQSQVLACATNVTGCQPGTAGSLKWQSPVLSGNVALLLPYASGSRIAAVTLHHTHFLRATDGQLANPTPLDPDGALVANAVQPGKGRDFYLLNGPAQAGAEALEVVALDSAELGDVFRYQILAGSMTAAVDDGGQVWLRIGKDLVKPLPLAEYRLVR